MSKKSLVDIIQSTVGIRKGQSFGSGTILSFKMLKPCGKKYYKNLIITAEHVIQKEYGTLLVQTHNVKKDIIQVKSIIRAKPILEDKLNDLAILKFIDEYELIDKKLSKVDFDFSTPPLYSPIIKSGCSSYQMPQLIIGQYTGHYKTQINVVDGNERDFYTINAVTWFGDSGGGVFNKDLNYFSYVYKLHCGSSPSEFSVIIQNPKFIYNNILKILKSGKDETLNENKKKQ